MTSSLPILLFAIVATATVHCQTPSGSVVGTVSDPTSAVIFEAQVELYNKQTGFRQTAWTNGSGNYSIAALPAGDYQIYVQKAGFQEFSRDVLVEASLATRVDVVLTIEALGQAFNVSAASPQLRRDSFDVSGNVTKSQVELLPLNGRNFLELAKLEPGGQTVLRGTNNRSFVPLVGAPNAGSAGAHTRVTVDGGDILQIGLGGTGMGFSQEVVQEFQVGTINYDISTAMTASGTVNVVTHSGGNELHGGAFLFFRDSHLSAYPGLTRSARAPDPFFQRRQYGFSAGGPLRRDTAFFFASYERNEQRGVISTELLTPEFAEHSRVTPSPTFVNQASMRIDSKLGNSNTGFLRYSHEDVSAFSTTSLRTFGAGVPVAVAVGEETRALPSAWTRQPAWADQAIIGLTSRLTAHLLNDLRISYFFSSTSELLPREADCPGCLGIGAPAISVQPDLFIGNSHTTRLLGRRYHLHDVADWVFGTHRIRFGGDFEVNRGGLIDTGDQPVSITLYSPQQVRDYNALSSTLPAARIPLPSSFLSLDDILQLPVHSFLVGIGNPEVPQKNFGRARIPPTAHFFIHDGWQVHTRLTLSYGLGWSYDGEGNYDLRKPAYLAPVLGEEGLGPVRKNWMNLSPSAGFAWSPRLDGKTVIRGGAGIYYDSRPGSGADAERVSLGPVGVGRGSYRSSGIPSPITVGTIGEGDLLSKLTKNPSLFTGAILLDVLPTIRSQLEEQRGDPNNRDFSTTNIERDKQGLVLASYLPDASAVHASVGLQREVARDFVVNADFVYRHFVHFSTGGGGFDLNNFNAARGPVLPICIGSQRNDPKAACSLGPIRVFSPIGRGRYIGLFVRADKRFSSRLQFLASYAYARNVGTNFGNGFNNDDRLASYGPLDRDVHHILSVSGVVDLPYAFQLGFVNSYNSRAPFSVFLGDTTTGFDLNGDGTRGDLLPGTTVGQFNRGLGEADLRRLVAAFNQDYAGKSAFLGGVIQPISLPPSFQFGDSFCTQDLRVSRDFRLSERRRLTMIGEVFNVFNIANLSGFNGDLTSPATFGQPNGRTTQVFGSGGPRAFQLAGRFSF